MPAPADTDGTEERIIRSRHLSRVVGKGKDKTLSAEELEAIVEGRRAIAARRTVPMARVFRTRR